MGRLAVLLFISFRFSLGLLNRKKKEPQTSTAGGSGSSFQVPPDSHQSATPLCFHFLSIPVSGLLEEL